MNKYYSSLLAIFVIEKHVTFQLEINETKMSYFSYKNLFQDVLMSNSLQLQLLWCPVRYCEVK